VCGGDGGDLCGGGYGGGGALALCHGHVYG
jgi:hypothetical protein